MVILSILSVLPLLLYGCGSSGGGSGSTGNAVRVSVGQSASLPAAPAAAASVMAPPADNIVHAWITVVRVALVPAGSMDPSDLRGPDPQGEQSFDDNGQPEAGLLSGDVVPATEIDLKNLPGGTVAQFLNEITNIPAGTYGKIRLYYRDPKVQFGNTADNVTVHPTANSHIDVHFVGGNLVIPVRTSPDNGVYIHDVTIRFVASGLKITVNPNKILMRPQIFAEVGPVQFGITGTADNVAAGSFDIATADARTFHALYTDNTVWFFRDNATLVAVSPARAIDAFKNTAIVDVFGRIPSGTTILADVIQITFPFPRAGIVVSGSPASGWKADNTFELNLATDNVVYPKPSRAGALYTGGADNAVVQGVFVTARGYRDAGPPSGVDAYWITIGP